MDSLERTVECKSPKNNEMHKHWELKPYGYRVYVYAYQYWLGTVRFLLMWSAELCPLFSLCSIIIWLVLIIHLCSVMLLSFFFFCGLVSYNIFSNFINFLIGIMSDKSYEKGWLVSIREQALMDHESLSNIRKCFWSPWFYIKVISSNIECTFINAYFAQVEILIAKKKKLRGSV